jgi:glycosyltransferase involved in cell wall biosynthesis
LTEPLVSVLLPAYNAGTTIAAALESVRRQDEPRWECVVVDDGSVDATGAVARCAKVNDPRFRVLEVPHRGVVLALQAGLAECRGRYVARMDADDLMRRDRLRRQLEVLERQPELSAVGSHVRLFPRGRLAGGMLAYERWLASIDSPGSVRREAFVECPVAHPTLTLRAAVLRRFGYRDRGWPEDYDLVLRMLAAGESIAVIPRRLLSWRDDPERLSRTSASCSIERIVACKAEFLASGPLVGCRQYILWGYGGTGKALARALERHDRHPTHIVELHPGRIGQRICGAEVIAPGQLPDVPPAPIVVSVAGAGPRSEIRHALDRMGYREGRHFVCAA